MGKPPIAPEYLEAAVTGAWHDAEFEFIPNGTDWEKFLQAVAKRLQPVVMNAVESRMRENRSTRQSNGATDGTRW